MTSENLNLISFFCGPGGLDEGFKNAGFNTSLAYDIDTACVITHQENHKSSKTLRADLSKIEVSEIMSIWPEVSEYNPVGVIGGPPCQSFSVSNVHQSNSDPRHKLPEHYARLLKGLNEAYNLDFFVFENVPGLVTSKHVNKFRKFKTQFEKAGFNVFEGALDAQYFGVAQERPRVFIVGINKYKHPNIRFEFPKPEVKDPKKVRDVLENLPEPIYFSRGLKEQDIPFHPNHWCMVPRSSKFVNGVMNPDEVMGRCFRVLSWDKPSYTVAYGHREVHVHPNGKRRLSVYEAMLLQGFPPNYVLKGTLSDQIRQVSEAVSPPVGKAIAEKVKEVLFTK